MVKRWVFIIVWLVGMAPVATQAGTLIRAGSASWYGPGFENRRMANGCRFHARDFIGASLSLPLGTRVIVRHRRNGRIVLVTITDRGPYRSHRIIDLSEAAAKRIEMRTRGVVEVELEVLPVLLAAPRCH